MPMQKVVMLAVDLLLIAGLFGMAGYYYTTNELSAGSWYIIQYDVDTVATAIQTASTGNGMVDMTLTLPPHSYLTLYNDNNINPSYAMVTGQLLNSQKSLEWVVANTVIEGIKKYNTLGYVQGPMVAGLASVFKHIVEQSVVVSHTQLTSPAIGFTLDNSLSDNSKQFNLTLDGTQKVAYFGTYNVPVVVATIE